MSERKTPAEDRVLVLPAVIGVISDTHGLLRAEALETLTAVDYIIHAGDVGQESILARLAVLAAVFAVRGNVDRDPWADRLPPTETLRAGTGSVHILHDVNEFRLGAQAAPVRVVVSGHSHRPSLRDVDGVLYLNPGSAGPRRFKLPVSVARLEIDAAGRITPTLIELGG